MPACLHAHSLPPARTHHSLCRGRSAREPSTGAYPPVYLGILVPPEPAGASGRGQTMLAHRLVCTLAHGLPDSWGPGRVDCVHLCDNKRCVNPLHLAWASRAVNASANASNEYEGVWRGRGGEAYYVGSGSVDQLAARFRQRLGDDSSVDGDADGSRGGDGGGDGGAPVAVAVAVDVAVMRDAA